MKSAYRMQCWIGIIGEKLHDSVFNLSFVIVSSGMHYLQSSLMMMRGGNIPILQCIKYCIVTEDYCPERTNDILLPFVIYIILKFYTDLIKKRMQFPVNFL